MTSNLTASMPLDFRAFAFQSGVFVLHVEKKTFRKLPFFLLHGFPLASVLGSAGITVVYPDAVFLCLLGGGAISAAWASP